MSLAIPTPGSLVNEYQKGKIKNKLENDVIAQAKFWADGTPVSRRGQGEVGRGTGCS